MKKYLLGLVLLLAGCAISPTGIGNAQYNYQHTAEGTCTLIINSARALEGTDVIISNDCTVSVRSDKAGADRIYLETIQTLAGAIPASTRKAIVP